VQRALFCLVGALFRGGMMSIAKVSPGSAYRYYLRKVAVGDGRRKRGVPLAAAQEQAGVLAGEWTGRGALLLGLSGVVTEAEMELLFGQGLHPHPEMVAPGAPGGGAPAVQLGRAFIRPTYWPDQEADAAEPEPEAVVPDDGEEPGEKRPRRRKKRLKRGPVAAWDLVVRAPASVQDLWALGDDVTRAAIEEAHLVAAGEALEWVEDNAIVVLSGPGGIKREQPVGGLVGARFRHHDSRHRMPLLHDHLVVSVKVLRADGKWGHLDSRTLYENVVTAGALYNQRVLEEVCDRLGLATEARTATPGRRPVMEIAGVPAEVIAWSSTRDRDTRERLAVLEAEYAAGHGYPATGRVRSRLMKTAADDTRTPKKTPLPLTELRRRWRADAIARFGAALVDGLLELCRRATAAIRSTWHTATGTAGADAVAGVDVDLAAVDVAVVVYIHHGEFRRRHLLAEARRHLARELRGRRAEPGLDQRITAAAVRRYCVDVTPPRPPGRPPRPADHTVYTATWHPGLPPREGRTETLEDSLRHPGLSPQRDGSEALDDGSVPQLSLHDRAVATSISLRAVLRNSRDSARPDQPGRAKRAGKPSPQDEATATALYGQLSFEDVPHDQDQEEDQEEVLLSRLAILERYARDAAERAAAAPKTEKRKPAPEPGVQQPKPEYRPYRR
jgi:conjugative relaxase-like TrwC/TraI family protein